MATQEAVARARKESLPTLIEAVTYRLGVHTTADDPTKYRDDAEMDYWLARDPIDRFERFIRARGAADAHFASVIEEGNDLAADTRARTMALGTPPITQMFDHVYSDPHPVIDEQRAWLLAYEAAMGGKA